MLPVNTPAVKLVADMMDNAVNKRQISSARTKDEITRKQQEQEIVKRGYVLHLPYKRKRCEWWWK
jgi:hypothetical protein